MWGHWDLGLISLFRRPGESSLDLYFLSYSCDIIAQQVLLLLLCVQFKNLEHLAIFHLSYIRAI